ncbi:MAG TPA: DUF167 domain-containing protein [Chloroflexi bacterium]|nr:DUF167 domain-containing protein [Chloroflexota bacterium]
MHNGERGAALTIRVTPRARKTQFGGVLEDGTLRIRVAAPPVEGKANQALIKFLAKVLGVRKNRIEIVAGERGLDKILSVVGMTAEEVEEKIRPWLPPEG